MSAILLALSWFLQPLLGCLYTVILLREQLTPNTWIGGLLILAALIPMVTNKKPRWKRSKQLELPFYPGAGFSFPAFSRVAKLLHF